MKLIEVPDNYKMYKKIDGIFASIILVGIYGENVELEITFFNGEIKNVVIGKFNSLNLITDMFVEEE